MSSSRSLSNSFDRWFKLSILHSGVPQQFGGVSPCHSRILKTEEEFLLNPYPFFRRFMVLALYHHLIIAFDCENSFHPSGAFHELFPFLSYEGHHVIILHSQRVAIILQILPVHRSSGLQSVHDLFILMYLNPLKYIHSFSNSSRWIVPLLWSFSILSMVRSRFHFLRYHIKYSLFPNPTSGSINTFSSLHYIPLNPFYENK